MVWILTGLQCLPRIRKYSRSSHFSRCHISPNMSTLPNSSFPLRKTLLTLYLIMLTFDDLKEEGY